MKHIRKKLVFLIAIVFAVCSAFTSQKFTPISWRFTGNECDWMQRVNPYYYVADPVSCYPGENHFCKIIANNNGSGKPVITNPSILYDNLVNGADVLPQPMPGLIYLKD